ncbi:hypothetical protein EMPG_09606 [Blastomyces silverae]|uniref:Uncharacterized protein n=1 Tax=Blastomyces silverae TaxID=2060906 RepID=A0A0H1BM04_9EURO|nr:hypothetical protein EMPG_09606 [Blastomyces silverae]
MLFSCSHIAYNGQFASTQLNREPASRGLNYIKNEYYLPGTSTTYAQSSIPCQKAIPPSHNLLGIYSTASDRYVYLIANRVGWGSLCVAGGGAYYFAKKSINADRAQRHEEAQRRKEEAYRREYSAKPPSSTSTTMSSQSPSSSGGGLANAARANGAAGMDDTGSPSREAGHDPAATRHEPETQAERVNEKGKYEASEQYTSRKGNRL